MVECYGYYLEKRYELAFDMLQIFLNRSTLLYCSVIELK